MLLDILVDQDWMNVVFVSPQISRLLMIGRLPVQSIHGTLVPVEVLRQVSFDLLLLLGIEDLIVKVTVGPSDEVTSRPALVFDEDGFNTGHFDVTVDICVC